MDLNKLDQVKMDMKCNKLDFEKSNSEPHLVGCTRSSLKRLIY